MASVLNRYVSDLENLGYQTPTGQRSKFAKTAKNNLNVNDRRSYVMLLEQLRKKGLKKFRTEQDSNPELCDADAVLCTGRNYLIPQMETKRKYVKT